MLTLRVTPCDSTVHLVARRLPCLPSLLLLEALARVEEPVPLLLLLQVWAASGLKPQVMATVPTAAVAARRRKRDARAAIWVQSIKRSHLIAVTVAAKLMHQLGTHRLGVRLVAYGTQHACQLEP